MATCSEHITWSGYVQSLARDTTYSLICFLFWFFDLRSALSVIDIICCYTKKLHVQSVQSCVTNTTECSSVIKLQGCRLCVILSREIGSVGDAENVLMFSAWSVSLTLLEPQLIEHRLENSSAWFLNHSAFMDVKSEDFTRLCPVCIYHLFLLIMSDWRSVGKF